MKNFKLERNILQWLYVLLVVLMVGFLLFVAFFQNVDVFQARQTSEVRMVEIYQYQEIADPETPIGMRREYKWKLDQIRQGEHCLAFYVVHHNVKVFFDDELVYRLEPKKSNLIGKTPANNWVMIPLYAEDIGKEITVDLLPVYENVKQGETTFFIGSQWQIYENELQADLPKLLLSVLSIVFGLILISFSLIGYFHGKMKLELIYLAFFSVVRYLEDYRFAFFAIAI